MSSKSIEEDCPFDFATKVISPKWNVNLVLELITEGDSLSFSEISDRIPEISPRMLSMRLKFLIENKIIYQIVNEDKPKKLRYNLTESGIKLASVLKVIRDWSLKFGNCTNEKCLNDRCKHGEAITHMVALEQMSGIS